MINNMKVLNHTFYVSYRASKMSMHFKLGEKVMLTRLNSAYSRTSIIEAVFPKSDFIQSTIAKT